MLSTQRNENENVVMQRKQATIVLGAAVLVVSLMVILNIETLLDVLNVVTSQYMLPAVALMMCVFASWLFNRNSLLNELKKGNASAENGFFWKILPN